LRYILREVVRGCRQSSDIYCRPGGQVYLVLNHQNGIRLPENVLDRIGVPGIVVKAKELDANGIRALAVEGFAP
jgi:hypothetical protein